jgi:hypothetical protein
MKNLPLTTCYIALASLCSSCSWHHKGETSISVSETKNYFKMSTYYDKSKTREVQKCIDKYLGSNNNFSFVNAETDATITLDDKTKFYIKSFPGELTIKFDKEENSYQSYNEIKEMCSAIKTTITEK